MPFCRMNWMADQISQFFRLKSILVVLNLCIWPNGHWLILTTLLINWNSLGLYCFFTGKRRLCPLLWCSNCKIFELCYNCFLCRARRFLSWLGLKHNHAGMLGTLVFSWAYFSLWLRCYCRNLPFDGRAERQPLIECVKHDFKIMYFSFLCLLFFGG